MLIKYRMGIVLCSSRPLNYCMYTSFSWVPFNMHILTLKLSIDSHLRHRQGLVRNQDRLSTFEILASDPITSPFPSEAVRTTPLEAKL